MAAEPIVIPKPAYNVLRRLTGESRPDVALSLALKDLVRLRMEAARSQADVLQRKYDMSFDAFENAWKADRIPDAHSYAVETDYSQWEAALSDIKALEDLAEWLV